MNGMITKIDDLVGRNSEAYCAASRFGGALRPSA
jgi:hypothetical protein